MGRTITPEVDAEVVERLHGYALEFRPLFGRSDRYKQGRVYRHGLLLDGERKSIEPLSRRVPGGNEQNLQQFVNQSPWDPGPILRAYRARMAAAFATDAGAIVIDDTGFPKQGKHSVGVARQYSGTLGKRANCQVATSLHYASGRGDYPLALRLYLPETWTNDPDRLEQARVPPDERAFRTKWQIALDLVDEVRAEQLPHAITVADAGYGAVTAFREGLEHRREAYVAEGRHHQVRPLEPAPGHHPRAGGRPLEGALAGRARLRAAQGRAGPRPLRGPELARLPPPRRHDLPGLRLPRPRAATGAGHPGRRRSDVPGGVIAGGS